MNDLQGKVALVTGGSRGLGRAIAVGLAQAGCDVAVNYARSRAEADEVCAQIRALGCRAVAVQADLGDREAPALLAAAVREALGDVSVLVNNAGIGDLRTVDTVDEAIWDRTHDINLKGAFLLSQTVLPAMRRNRWGRLVYIASTAAQTGGVVGPHYAASKAGLIGLAHSYASLLAREGVTANAIAMALVETDMLKSASHIRPEIVPVGRFGQPEEVARAAVFLAETGYVTGQTLNVNGGVYYS